jgi:lipoprotein-anchoring transpeptidase ErfK/SrfK
MAARIPGLAPMVALLLAALAAAPAGAQAAVRPAKATAPLGNERLSNEWDLSRYAYAVFRAPIRTEPRKSAQVVGRLRYQTEDRLPEPYPTLRSRLDADERPWIKVRVPGRPNGRTGWVPRHALSEFRIVRHQITVDRRRLRATLYKSGRRIWTARIGHGKPSTPTPRGRYIIRERLRAMGGIYGPWAFGTSAYAAGLTDWPGGGVIGIHGTDQPYLIPGRPSNGCIRVRNRKISRLARRMPIGTPLHIK